jgi:UDP-N-acetylglucosamine:LPS N-acetylglucosamine transferase
MGAAMTIADLVISRAGAAVLGEYPHFGLPAILVPYPHAWRYQLTNAQYLVHHGGAILLEDAKLGEKLIPEVLNLIFNRQRLEEMNQAMKSAATPDAATKIAGILQRLSLPVESSRM